MWDLLGGKAVLSLGSDYDPPLSLAVSEDGARIAVAGFNAGVVVYDARTGGKLRALPSPQGQMYGVAFRPGGMQLATSSAEGVKTWDLDTGRPILAVPLLYQHNLIRYSPDGRLMAVSGSYMYERNVDSKNSDKMGRGRLSKRGIGPQGGDWYQTRIIDADDGRLIHTLAGGGPIFTPDGRRLLTLTRSPAVTTDPLEASLGEVVEWDLKSGAKIKTHPTALVIGQEFITWSADARRLAAGRWVWDLDAGKEIARTDGDAILSPDGTRIAVVCNSRRSGLSDLLPGEQMRSTVTKRPIHVRGMSSAATDITVEARHRDEIFATAWFPDGTRFATAGDDGKVVISDAATGATVLTLYDDERAGHAAAWSPTQDRLAVACWDNAIRIWDAGTWSEPSVLRGHTDTINEMRWSPDGRRVASVGEDGTLRVWNLVDANELFRSAGHSPILAVAWSFDGRRLATGEFNGRIRIWDADTGKGSRVSAERTSTFTAENGSYLVKELAWNSDGRFLAVKSLNGAPWLWEVVSAKRTEHRRGAPWPLWSPDGRLVAYSEAAITLFDVKSNRSAPVATGVTWPTGRPALTPDGRRIAFAGGDHSVVLYDTATGQQVLKLRGFSDQVTHVAFSRDGNILAAAAADGSVRVYDATPLDQLRRRATSTAPAIQSQN